ncbi:MAG: magnesium transporter [Sphingomonadales bacterium 32-68-7]|nr:MAG: magnesium transporter [Sphingomonadales bacterium 12-68-11]OYX10359.1 MAG: magnesium transporter [Sphingomonadales bacterium 32-68-7]
MTIVAARRYRDGKVVDPALPRDCAPPAHSEFDWIGLFEPTAEEMEHFRAKYGLHPLAVEDAQTGLNSPKAEAFGAQLFVIARTAAKGEGDKIAYGQTAIFLGKDFIITVRQGSTRAHLNVRKDLEAKSDRLGEGADLVLHAVLDFIVDGYGPLLDDIEDTVGQLEEGAIGRFPDQARIRRIFRLRRELRRFETIAGQMEEVAGKLAKVEQPAIDPRARPYFRDVFDHAHRAAMRTRGLNETLGYILEVAGLLEQSRQGSITRQLAAWAAILAVPTAIAGIYGMNFDVMPELRWEYGYFAVLGVIASICGLLYWQFKRIGWL